MTKCIGGPCDGMDIEPPERPDWPRQSRWFQGRDDAWKQTDEPRRGHRYIWHVGRQAWVFDETCVLSELEVDNG